MITCSRCGNIVSTGQSSCQYCGMPVMNRSEYGASAGRTTPDQPELPAWLQSLRAGTQPTYTTGGNNNFSDSDLVEEGALPGWMQPGQPDAANSNTGQHPVLRPSSMPAPDTDGSVFPGGNMSASSLIDEQSLPSWMREQAGDRQGLSAASLVQPGALPDWLRDAQAGSQAQQPGQPLPPQVSGRPPQSPQTQQTQQAQRSPQTPPALQPVPPPLNGTPQQQPIAPPMQGQWQSQMSPFQAQQSLPTPPQSAFPAQGLSAQNLVDPQSLPSWLSGQPGTPANGEGLSASSLLDMNALPPWLRENAQGSPVSQGPQAAMNRSGSQAPMQPQQSQQSQQQQQPPAQNASAGNLVAASFIDMDALPDWLRAADDGQSRSANGGMPPRVENVRVPGRPRGGVGPQEASAAAANVFASMLGVASNAPQLPAQPQQGVGPQGQAPFQSAQGNTVLPEQTQGQAQAQGYQVGPQGQAQVQGYPGPGYGYGPQGYQAGPQGQQGYPVGSPSYQMGSQLGVSQPPPNQGMPMSPASPIQPGQVAQYGQPAQMGQAKKPAKRGFLDTIREWFGLNS